VKPTDMRTQLSGGGHFPTSQQTMKVEYMCMHM